MGEIGVAKWRPETFQEPLAATMMDSGDRLQCARAQLVCMKLSVSATLTRPCLISNSLGPSSWPPCTRSHLLTHGSTPAGLTSDAARGERILYDAGKRNHTSSSPCNQLPSDPRTSSVTHTRWVRVSSTGSMTLTMPGCRSLVVCLASASRRDTVGLRSTVRMGSVSVRLSRSHTETALGDPAAPPATPSQGVGHKHITERI